MLSVDRHKMKLQTVMQGGKVAKKKMSNEKATRRRIGLVNQRLKVRGSLDSLNNGER